MKLLEYQLEINDELNSKVDTLQEEVSAQTHEVKIRQNFIEKHDEIQKDMK